MFCLVLEFEGKKSRFSRKLRNIIWIFSDEKNQNVSYFATEKAPRSNRVQLSHRLIVPTTETVAYWCNHLGGPMAQKACSGTASLSFNHELVHRTHLARVGKVGNEINEIFFCTQLTA